MNRIVSVAAAALLASTTLSLAQTTMEGDADTEGTVIIEEDGMSGSADATGSATMETDPGTTASIDLSAEQQTELRTILSDDATPVESDFEIAIGASPPDTVTVYPLPPRFVEVVPQYEGYEYFLLADGRIVIIKPDTREIVYIMS